MKLFEALFDKKSHIHRIRTPCSLSIETICKRQFHEIK